MKPLYTPSGAAKEYGDLAINIYTGCPHSCYYCFAPTVLHRDREVFHGVVEPRKDIVEETKRQIEREGITGKLVHLCFVCDPYPTGYDTSVTREIIKVLKGSGNHVQILTKGDGRRDFDLLDGNDWYGATISGELPSDEPGAATWYRRYKILHEAHDIGIKTWLSCEPVLSQELIFEIVEHGNFIDKFKIGKLNYHPSDIDWKVFGAEVERLCKVHERDYYIKQSLREEMEK